MHTYIFIHIYIDTHSKLTCAANAAAGFPGGAHGGSLYQRRHQKRHCKRLQKGPTWIKTIWFCCATGDPHKSKETSKKETSKIYQKRRQRRHQKRPIDIKCATDFSARQETHINQKRHQKKIKKNVEGDIKRDPDKSQESDFCARQEAHPRCRRSSRRRSRRAWLLSLSTATRRLNMRSLPRLLGRYADVCT